MNGKRERERERCVGLAIGLGTVGSRRFPVVCKSTQPERERETYPELLGARMKRTPCQLSHANKLEGRSYCGPYKQKSGVIDAQESHGVAGLHTWWQLLYSKEERTGVNGHEEDSK